MADQFTFSAEVWVWPGDTPWHFISLPQEVADEIEVLAQGKERGFGSVPVDVSSGDTHWRTSLFPSKQAQTYLLPVKKQVRQQLGCAEGSRIKVTLRIAESA